MAYHLSSIDVPEWCRVYTEKAILASVQLLTVQEFIQTKKFELDNESFDILYMSINRDDVPIYINSKILKWMAYEGDFRIMKTGYTKLLKSNFKVDSEYKILTNDEYKKYYDEKIECCDLASFYPKHKKGNKSHLLVYPNAFKASVMMLKTSKGSQIRDYYITLEKLIKAYVIYQALFKGREAEQAMLCKDNYILEIKNMLSEDRKKHEEDRKKYEEERIKSDHERKKADEYRIKAEEREKKYEEERIKSEERFRRLLGIAEETKEQSTRLETKLDKVMPGYVKDDGLSSDKLEYLVVLYMLNNPYNKKFKIIRGQKSRVDTTLADIRRNTYEIILNIKVPNAIKFWLAIKKQCPNILGDEAVLTKYGKYQLYGSHTITKTELLQVISRVKEIWNQDLEYPSEEE